MTRLLLTSNLVLYVSTSGSDSNDGLTPSTPWLTLNHAVSVVANNYDLQGFQLDIQLAPDAVNKYAAVTLLNFLDTGVWNQHNNPRILGDPVHPDLYQVDAGSAQSAVIAVGITSIWLLEGITITCAPTQYGITVDYFSKLYCRAIQFGNCGVHCAANYGATIEFLSDGTYPLYYIKGTTAYSLTANIKGLIVLQTGNIVCAPGTNIFGALVLAIQQSFCYFGGTMTGSYTLASRCYLQQQSGLQGLSRCGTASGPNTIDSSSYAT